MRRTVVLTAVVVAMAGCGGGGSEGGGSGGGGTQTASAGKTLFTAKCGSCHTLKDAGTGGSFGPNLDQLKPDEQTVLHQIANGGGGMPAGLYKGAQAKTVAQYVSSSAGG